MESVLRFILITAVAAYELVFWFHDVPALEHYPCVQYGFFLAKLPLNAKVLQVLNILLYFGVLVACVVVLLIWAFKQPDKSGHLEIRYSRQTPYM